ncbi:hypothetical protein C8Q79DRAFT_904275 [Trametes meyenii]|nr:hypothetical protein C8Q79DRAFT_904275 [Trametes meyenii]
MPRGGGNVTCFFCEKIGHYKSDCPDRAAWEAFKAKKSSRQANTAIAATVSDVNAHLDDYDYSAVEEVNCAW